MSYQDRVQKERERHSGGNQGWFLRASKDGQDLNSQRKQDHALPCRKLFRNPIFSKRVKPISLPGLQPLQLCSSPSFLPRPVLAFPDSYRCENPMFFHTPALSAVSTRQALPQLLGFCSNKTSSLKPFPQVVSCPSSVFPQPLVCVSLAVCLTPYCKTC